MELESVRAALRGHICAPVREGPVVRASVLIPLVEREEGLCVLFEERSAGIPQGGEICFPGGHVEAGEDPAETALRETAEELLLPRKSIELLAPLHLLSGERGREISSFLGLLHSYEGTMAREEVSRTFLLPLDRLRAQLPRISECRLVLEPGEDFPYEWVPGGRDYPFASGRQRMYFYPTEYGVIWGLTAKLLYHFLGLLPPPRRT